ncbi:MAG: magnesium/cobalt transporter CorA [Syntrophorhabdus sp.]|nr:magnesium/cobalt transporter CorA [Syntrophorhabdus sp.]
MAGSRSRRSAKAGLPPGSLVHVGKHAAGKATITVVTYGEGEFRVKEASSVEECFSLIDPSGVTWVNVDGINDAKTVEAIGSRFNLHPLLLEDVMNTEQRPKMEDYDNLLFLVLRVLFPDNGAGRIGSDQISFVLGDRYLISFQERKTDLFKAVIDRLQMGKSRIRKSGADYLLYSLIDVIVDNYFVILELIGDNVEEMEVRLISGGRVETLAAIQRMKKDLIYLRRSVWPLREALSGLERGESRLISGGLHVFFRDIYDHTIHAIDTIESLRDMLSGMLDIYLSSVSNRLNQVMKVLTIISTIFIPLTFIAGVYGMNFKNIPEIGWEYGYPASLALMVLVSLAMLYYFKKKKWF